MSITRANAEKILIARAGTRMAFVEMDNATVDGTNENLADPIASALLDMDIEPADVTDPADGDISQIGSIPEFLDRAELRLMENILGNCDAVDISEGPRSESFGQFVSSLQDAIQRKKDAIDSAYGGSLGELTGGRVTLNFATKGDDEYVA